MNRLYVDRSSGTFSDEGCLPLGSRPSCKTCWSVPMRPRRCGCAASQALSHDGLRTGVRCRACRRAAVQRALRSVRLLGTSRTPPQPPDLPERALAATSGEGGIADCAILMPQSGPQGGRQARPRPSARRDAAILATSAPHPTWDVFSPQSGRYHRLLRRRQSVVAEQEAIPDLLTGC